MKNEDVTYIVLPPADWVIDALLHEGDVEDNLNEAVQNMRTDKKKEGLSFSMCIEDILLGLVDEDDVEGIIAGTKCVTPADWEKTIAYYRESYWDMNPDKGELIARRFIMQGKVYQPRVYGEALPSLMDGVWR